MPLTDEEIDRIAAKVADRVQGNNGTEEAVTLALLDQKLKRICPLVTENHEAITQVVGLRQRVARLEGYLMGLGGLQVIGLAIMSVAVKLGWL